VHKVKHFVFGGSSSVYGENKKIPFSENDKLDNMISPYAVSKRAGEMMCNCYHKLYGMNIVSLRFFTVYGPRGRPDMAPYLFTDKIMKGKQILKFGDGSSKRDYTFVSDIVDGIIRAMDFKGFDIFNIGNNDPISLNDFISLIERLTGKKAIIMQVPMQQGDVPITYADISKSKKKLGYNPKVKIEDGMRQFVEWLKNGI